MPFSTTEPLAPPAFDAHGFATLGAIESIEQGSEFSVVLTCDGGARLRIDALSDDVLRIRHARPGSTFAGDDSYALDPESRWTGPTKWSMRHTGDRVTMQTAALCIQTSATVLRLRITDIVGNCLYEEDGGAAWTDDRVAHSVRLDPQDRLLGLGDKALTIDRRGNHVSMWNTDAFMYERGTDPLYKSIPFVLRLGAEHAAGLFYDNTHRTHFDLDESGQDRMRWETPGGGLDLYVITAAEPIDIVRQFARLTGRTPMLPKWALGYHQCRYSYLSADEVREVAREFRQREIPCDTLYFDIHYMEGFRVFTWDRDAFPDPPGLLADLRRDGFTSVCIVDPGVRADAEVSAVFRAGLEIDAFVRYPGQDGQPGPIALGEVWPGTCAFPDFTRQDVREWWGGLHAGLLDAGVDGIWNDMNEPALFSVAHVEGTMNAEHNVGTLPDETLHAFEGRGGTHREAHNIYGMQMMRATYGGLKTLRPEKRPFTITRAAYAGNQRFGTAWTGDNSATWDHLRLAVQTCLSLGVSGMPFTGSDVGGFVGTPSGELLARWTQLGALTPLFRNHSAIDTPRQEPWLFGDEVERVCREAIELRYRLLPALYTALWQAATDGTPIMRPLALVHPEDETILHTSPLGFYIGDSLLAQPVVEEGQSEREVYLPPSPYGWYDFWTGEHVEGRQTLWIQTPLDRIPLYVRGGSVLALGPVRPSTATPVDRLDVHVYIGDGDFESVLYEDAGDGWGFESGDFWSARFVGSQTPEALNVSIDVTGSHTPEWSGWDVAVHGLASAPLGVLSGGAKVPFEWDGRVLRFASNVGGPFRVAR